MKDKTMAVHLEQFTQTEKAIMCFLLNTDNVLGYEVHQGLLPFVRADVVVKALKSHPSRKAQEMAAAVKGLYDIQEYTKTWIMYLNSVKVIRRFGAHPERGHKIQYAQKKRVTVGVKWSLPKKDYVPDDDVLVEPHVALQCVGKDRWKVICDPIYENLVSQYLLDYCV